MASKPRRKYTISPAIRANLELQADDLAAKLAEGDLTATEATELVATVVGSALEMAVEMAGAPDKVGDLAKKLGTTMALAIAEALRPDPEKLLEKATEAMRAGDFSKARRLMDKAERVQARQAGR